MADPYKATRDLYRRAAADYDAGRRRGLFERKWLDKVLARCPDYPRILYLGCGAGEPVARYLIEAGARLTGVDFAPEMLEIARGRFPDHDWIEADIRNFAADTPFDAVVMWSVLFHLTPDDQRAMFPRFAALARPGAPLLFQTGLEAGETFGTVAGRPVYHATLDAAEYRDLLAEHGFSGIEFVPQDPESGGFSPWLALRAG